MRFFKIRFIQADDFALDLFKGRTYYWKGVGGDTKWPWMGYYNWNTGVIYVVRQRNLYRTGEILVHELCHWVVHPRGEGGGYNFFDALIDKYL